MNALIYLVYRQAINNLRHTFSSAKRLIPILLMGFLLGQSIITNILTGHGAPQRVSAFDFSKLSVDVIWSIVFTLLTLRILSVVDSAFSEGRLGFVPAHVDFLFPSPIDRRLVLALKLVGDCIRYTFFTAFLLFWIAPGIYRVFDANVFPSIWASIAAVVLLIVSCMNITHALNIAASVGAQRLALLRGVARSIIAAILLAVVMLCINHYLATANPLESLVAATKNGLVKTVLAPIGWCTNIIIGPIVGQPFGNRGLQLLGLAAMAAASFIVVMLRPENMYEPSLAVSARWAKVREAQRSGNWLAARAALKQTKINQKAQSSPIPPFGKGAFALLWKMMVIQLRTSSWTLILLIILPPVVAYLCGRFVPDPHLLKYSPFIIPYVTWMLINMCMAGLKNDFRQAEIIKTIPDTAFKIVAVQVIGQWMKILTFVAIAMWSMMVFVPGADVYLLSILSVASVSVGFAGASVSSVLASIYPDTRDKLAMTIPGCLAVAGMFAVVIPTAVIVGVAIAMQANLLIANVLLVITNALIAWGLLAISAAAFRNADPNEG